MLRLLFLLRTALSLALLLRTIYRALHPAPPEWELGWYLHALRNGIERDHVTFRMGADERRIYSAALEAVIVQVERRYSHVREP